MGDGSTRPRGHEWGWVPVPVFTGAGSAPAFTRGWVHASARTRGGDERLWVPVPVFTGASALDKGGKEKERGWFPVSVFTIQVFTGMQVLASARTRGGEDFTPILAFPPQGGRKKRGDGFPSLSSRGSGSAPVLTRGWVHASARTRGGEDFTPILAFPPQGGRKKRGDGSPSLSSRGSGSARIDEGMGPSARTRGWVHASARTRGGGEDFTPILAFPPQGGRKKRGDGFPHPRGQGRGCGRLEGLPVAAGFSSDDVSEAWGGEVSGGYCYALLRKNI